jgi:hypothetical protein
LKHLASAWQLLAHLGTYKILYMKGKKFTQAFDNIKID